ncbi:MULTISPECIES: hypothetical protein [Geobacillus]|uniref:hypothetical protein n=1 Tax=Geobacillus TaxID=129337 RepID=UPI0009C162F0|nr:hypothetical protein [Geobacillus sp. 46C-IIa]OQP07354.1 hypothetical protein B1690_05600 [Geobacillus sp. 46C-IIa]QNU26566.1 hypothetical protein IC803_09475 [Geobacillus sp. 46C-IIa]
MGEITNEMIWQAIKELADQLQQTNGQVEQLAKQVQQTNEQVEQLAKQVQQTNEQLHRLSQQVSDMDQRLTDVANGQKILVEELFENKKEIKRVKMALNLY